MNNIQKFMLQSEGYSGLLSVVLKLETQLNEHKEKLKEAAVFSVRFEGWSSSRALHVYPDKIRLEVTPHRDGCETCRKRLAEIYSLIDTSICSVVTLGSSRWDSWVEIPIVTDCDPLELISRALRGRKINHIS